MNRYDGKRVKNWSKYVSHKCIVVEDRWCGLVNEVKVLEVSPKGRVKFQFPSKCECWEDRDTFLLIEDLGYNDYIKS